MSHSPTNLTKGFKLFILFGFFSTALMSCGSTAKEVSPTLALVGKWKVTNVSTTKTNKLDAQAKAFYTQQLLPMLDSSFLEIKHDSTYLLQMGPDKDTGIWILNNDVSKLVLRSKTQTVTRFIVQLKTNALSLTNVDAKDSTCLTLQRL